MGVGEGAIALDGPACSLGISDDETLRGFVVSHGEYGVAAELFFDASIRHGDFSCLRRHLI